MKIKEMFGEKPDGSEEMGKMINDFHTDRMERIINTSGGKVVIGGKVKKDIKFVEPTVILEPKKDSELMTEEIFGPIMPVYPFKDVSEVMKMVKGFDKPLAVYYFGKPGTPCMMRLQNETSSGCFMTNEVVT